MSEYAICWNEARECQVIATLDLEGGLLHYDTMEMDGMTEVIVRCHICGAMDVWIE